MSCISTITIGVRDLRRSERFYAEGFGFTTTRDHHGVIYVGDAETRLALYARESLEAYTGCELATDWRPPAGVLSHNVSSATQVDILCAKLTTAGGRLRRPAGPVFWGGYIAWVSDPDGVLWELVFNPKRPA